MLWSGTWSWSLSHDLDTNYLILSLTSTCDGRETALSYLYLFVKVEGALTPKPETGHKRSLLSLLAIHSCLDSLLYFIPFCLHHGFKHTRPSSLIFLFFSFLINARFSDTPSNKNDTDNCLQRRKCECKSAFSCCHSLKTPVVVQSYHPTQCSYPSRSPYRVHSYKTCRQRCSAR